MGSHFSPYYKKHKVQAVGTAKTFAIMAGRIFLAIGLAVFAVGCWLETRAPRTNEQDDFAFLILHVGASVLGIGYGLRFVPFPVSIFVAILGGIALPYLAFFAVIVTYIGGGAIAIPLLLGGSALVGIFTPSKWKQKSVRTGTGTS